MTQYKIERWDAVMFGNSITKVPMIYVKPDTDFLEFVRENNYNIICEISGTDSPYDGKHIPGIVDKSCNVPNARPNYYEKTGYYVITLRDEWYGYPTPEKMGTVLIKGVNGSITEQEYIKRQQAVEDEQTNSDTTTTEKTECKKFNAWRITNIVIGLIAIALLLYFIRQNYKQCKIQTNNSTTTLL